MDCSNLDVASVGCCDCCNNSGIDFSYFDILIRINTETFKATGTPTNIVLCHNGNVATFKQWKTDMKEVGVTLSSTILSAIEDAYEATLSTLLGSNQSCT